MNKQDWMRLNERKWEKMRENERKWNLQYMNKSEQYCELHIFNMQQEMTQEWLRNDWEMTENEPENIVHDC